MTDEEKRKRINELESEINKLRKERDEYQSELHAKKKEDELAARKKLVGKCFYIDSNKSVINENSSIKAFKILNISKESERYAKCIILYDGHGTGCWLEKSIKISTIGLWTRNIQYMSSKESDPYVIELYNEISQEDFVKLYKEYANDIEKDLNCKEVQ